MTERLFVAAAFVVTWAVIAGYYIHLRRVGRRARTLFDRSMTMPGGEDLR